MKSSLSILFSGLFLSSLFLATSCAEDDKTACVQACEKYTKCNKQSTPDRGAVARDAKAGGKDAGAGGTYLPMLTGPGDGVCKLTEACTPKEDCLAGCVNAGSCDAITGKDPAGAKTVLSCINDCNSKKWDAGTKKDSGQCKPQCGTRKCGPNGCGGNCGTCATGQKCDTTGKCIPGTCTPQCSGKQCGPNGCGGQCGTCPAGKTCNSTSGQCVATCTPQCAGKQCGDNGCGGQCGTCPTNHTCNSSGQCVPNCQPQCSGKECGDNGCGGSCGACPSGFTCDSVGHCQPACQPQCAGRVCGPDQCGGSCGTCKSYETCDAGGQCQQTGCGPITSTGCCDGQVLKYCLNGTFQTLDCAPLPSCGWNGNANYDCGTPGGSDPSGVHPKACP